MVDFYSNQKLSRALEKSKTQKRKLRVVYLLIRIIVRCYKP